MQFGDGDSRRNESLRDRNGNDGGRRRRQNSGSFDGHTRTHYESDGSKVRTKTRHYDTGKFADEISKQPPMAGYTGHVRKFAPTTTKDSRNYRENSRDSFDRDYDRVYGRRRYSDESPRYDSRHRRGEFERDNSTQYRSEDSYSRRRGDTRGRGGGRHDFSDEEEPQDRRSDLKSAKVPVPGYTGHVPGRNSNDIVGKSYSQSLREAHERKKQEQEDEDDRRRGRYRNNSPSPSPPRRRRPMSAQPNRRRSSAGRQFRR